MTAKSKLGIARRRLLLIDDHATVREGLGEVINRQDDLVVCGEADSAEDGFAAIASTKPDLVLADISMDGRNGIELIKDIRVRYPKMPVLVLSMHDESVYAERALLAGAQGYVRKHVSIKQVLVAIRQVLAGGVHVSQELAARFLPDGRSKRTSLTGVESLTDRELEVFELIGRGHRTSQIAAELHLSEKTIETHRANTRLKLNLQGGSELLQCAIQWVQSQGNR